MLSPNTLLNKARYRVDGLHLGGSLWNVYTATDQTSGAAVLVVEFSAEPVEFPQHEGLLKISDTFLMNGRRYDVTEPVQLAPRIPSVTKAWDEFSITLMALNAISAVANTRCEICPRTLVATAAGAHKLLPLGPAAGAPVEIESWYVPLERIWRDLDHVSERAIYNAWGEASIADLERPLDEPSDIYSTAALFYKVITGTTPPGAFERTVVSLDGSDPLLAPHTLSPELGEEAGAHLMRCLEVRRSERFRSFEEAIMNLPTLSLTEPAVDEEHDVLDLGVSARAAATTTVDTVVSRSEPEAVTESAAEAHFRDVPSIAIDQQSEEPIFLNTSDIVPATATVDIAGDTDAPIFTVETAGKGRSGMKFAFAGVLMAVLAGIGWAAYQYSQANLDAAPAAVSAQVTAPVIRNEPVATPTPVQSDQQTFTPVNASSDVTADPVQVDTSAKDASRQRPQVAVKAAPKTAPATDKPKKKVTVDDLINDN